MKKTLFTLCALCASILTTLAGDPSSEPYTVVYDPLTTTIEITPADNEATYFWCVVNDQVLSETKYTDKFTWFDDYMIRWAWASDVASGTTLTTVEDYENYWMYGLYDGTNYVMICPATAHENGAEGYVERTGDIHVYEIHIGEPDGLRTTLRTTAAAPAYNLQGQRIQRQQMRGISIVGSKKIMK